ncbi:unnamed protein product [Closterium sp. Yama58-4]|nr:unnamed protein product [Closterium sp. Yama58-4]
MNPPTDTSSNGDPGSSSTPTANTSATATAATATVRRARPTTQPSTNRRLEVIDLDTIVLWVPDPNTPLNADDDTLAYFDAGEVDTDFDEHVEEEGEPAMMGEKRGWEDAETMQLAWVRHDKDEEYRSQSRLQGQNRDVTLWEELKKRHPQFRHKFQAVKSKLFRMEAHYRKVRALLLEPSGKGRPIKIPIYYEVYDRVMGDRANARPPALAGSLPGANVVRTPPTTPGIAGMLHGRIKSNKIALSTAARVQRTIHTVALASLSHPTPISCDRPLQITV